MVSNFKKIFAAVAVSSLMMTSAALAKPKTLVFCSDSSPDTFGPSLTYSAAAMDASSQSVFNRLIELKIGTTDLTPGLAEKWDISKDGLTYTFHLRKGVKFHSGNGFKPTRDFNADDVLFTFNRQGQKDHPFHKVSGGAYNYYTDMGLPANLEHIKKLDDYTVEFKLKEPNASFLAVIAMDFASILSAEYGDYLVKKGKLDDMDWHPIGTGPFVFLNYKKDSTIRYKANDNYWRERPKIDNLIFAITLDPAVRFAKLKAGECHVMSLPNPSDIPAMEAHPDINVLKKEGLNVGFLALNTQKKPFDDPRVRRAMNLAINKQAIMDAIYHGSGAPAKNPVPPTMWSYNEKTKDYGYDPEKAKALLKEAGLENGFKTDIWAMPVQRAYNPNARRMAELMQEDLSKVGIEAEIVTYEWGEYIDRSLKGEHQMVLLGWGADNGDPDNFFGTQLSCKALESGGNLARWCYKPFDDLVEKAVKISDKKERTKLYHTAQEIFVDQAPWVPIAHSVRQVPVRKEVKNYEALARDMNDFSIVDLED